MKTLATKDLTYISFFSIVIALCAWLTIPTTIPFTLQTFGVFLTLLVLGGKKGTLSILIYLFLGAMGLPVFASMRGGIGALLDLTGGFLVGLLFIGIVYSLFKEKFISLLIGLILCYLIGTLWFMMLGQTSFINALMICVVPFVGFDILKLYLACLISQRLKKHLKV